MTEFAKIANLSQQFMSPIKGINLDSYKTPYYDINSDYLYNLTHDTSYKVVLVVGNGFDLDAGMRTSYKHFKESTEWEELINDKDLDCLLQRRFREISEEKWLGIEEELKRHAISMSEISKDKHQDSSYQEFVEKDKYFFDKLCNALKCYLSQTYNKNGTNSCAIKLLQSIVTLSENIRGVENHRVSIDIISFNYTELMEIAKIHFNQGYPEVFKEITHVHGKLDDYIILGTDESKLIPQGYEFLFKSWNENYQSHFVLDQLASAKELIFFGLSFGAIDLVYFYKFFRDICAGKYDENRKNIYIITQNNASRINILREIYKMDIPMMELKAHCNLQFIYTTPGYGQNLHFKDLLNHIHGLKDLTP